MEEDQKSAASPGRFKAFENMNYSVRGGHNLITMFTSVDCCCNRNCFRLEVLSNGTRHG